MAITIRKERNLVYLQSDTKTKPYIIDLSNGRLYGLKGDAVCNTPVVLRSENWKTEDNILYNYLSIYVADGRFRSAPRYTAELATYEKLGALNNPHLRYARLTSHQMAVLNNHWSAICKVINSLTEDTYINSIVNNSGYMLWKEKNGIEPDEHFTEDMCRMIYNCYNKWSKEKIHRAAYFMAKGLYEFFGESSNCLDKIEAYFHWCELLGEQPTKGDFLRLYVEAKRKYKLRKTEIDNKAISDYQTAVAHKLAFEDDNFIVIVPTTAQEIIAEGEAQHNCVGRLYLPKVVNKETHIVFIRQKNVPNDSFITCEVNNNGAINQYLLAYNRWVDESTPEAEFKKAYKEHLKNCW